MSGRGVNQFMLETMNNAGRVAFRTITAAELLPDAALSMGAGTQMRSAQRLIMGECCLQPLNLDSHPHHLIF